MTNKLVKSEAKKLNMTEYVGQWKNKLAKARKTRKSPGMLSLKMFRPGKLRVEKVWAQNKVNNFLAV